MPLTAGTLLGPYEILAPLGAGGMGEVYKARDTRLDRFVAVKVLPEHLAQNPEAMARFEREAKAVAALSHPNIMGIFDFSSQQGTAFVVMELLEGQSLRELLGQGPVGPRRATELAIQMAQGLAAAHAKGVVHRDLKPENLWITLDGRLKILDFGLAKQVSPLGSASGAPLQTEVLSRGNATEQGMILGTLGYMSPEQVRGEAVDGRADIFGFGAVLFELLTGRKAFARATPADTLSAILKEDLPEVDGLSRPIPPGLRRILDHCLEKAPGRRFHDAEDLAFALENLASASSSQASFATPFAPRNRRVTWLWGALGLVLAGAAGLLGWAARGGPRRLDTVRFELTFPPEVASVDAFRISPDGLHLALHGMDSTGRSRVWLRHLNAVPVQALPGSEGAGRPFWSPDSRFLAFIVDGKLMKVDIAGGPAQKICDALGGADGSWSREGVILFDGSAGDPIRRVAAAGGVASVAMTPDPTRKEKFVAWPEFLPDGQHFLYQAQAERIEDSQYRVGRLGSTESQPLMPGQTLVAYSAPGYLLFVRDTTLLAQRFDPGKLRVSGEPAPVAEHVGTGGNGFARFSAAQNGTLVYQTGEPGNQLQWLDRSGREAETVVDTGEYKNPSLAPGGDRVAYDLADSGTGKVDVWIRDLKRKVSSRFTFNGEARMPLWSPDGATIAFTRGLDLYAKPVGGQGEEKLLAASPEIKVATGWSPDGQHLSYSTQGKETNWDIWVLPMGADHTPVPFLQTPFAELRGVFSPDGRFMAYQSNESGRAEVYVQSFPGPGGKWQISSGGGIEPFWRGDGKELFYRAADRSLMAVDIQAGAGLEVGTPHALFPGRFDLLSGRNHYQPSADGQRFLVVAPKGREGTNPTVVVLNWPAERARN